MKTLIIYSTKYGCTEKCAKTLSEKLTGEVELVNTKKDSIPNLAEYNKIIIGGSIYIGKIQKEIKEFCEKNLDVLKNKTIALFVCCGFPEKLDLQFSFPKELIETAVIKEVFGGELNKEKMKLIDRILTNFIEKATAKEGKMDASILPENINKLAELMNSL